MVVTVRVLVDCWLEWEGEGEERGEGGREGGEGMGGGKGGGGREGRKGGRDEIGWVKWRTRREGWNMGGGGRSLVCKGVRSNKEEGGVRREGRGSAGKVEGWTVE